MPLWLSKGESRPPKKNGEFWGAYTEMMSYLEKLEIEGYERIGHVAVDTGMVILGDPINLRHAEDLDYKNLNTPAVHHKLGGKRERVFAIHTGLGDGFYPVFIRRGFQDRVAELVVVFLPPMEDEDIPAEATRVNK